MRDAGGLKKLHVYERRVASADGEVSSEPVVSCPRRCAAATLDECRCCAEYEGLSLDTARERGFVVCDAPNPQIPASMPDRALVTDGISSVVLCVRDDLALDALAALFLRQDVSSAAVVDAGRRPIGMISSRDLLAERRAGATVADAMTPLTFFVRTHATIDQAAALMAYEGVHQVPIVSDDEQVIGVLTSLDVLRWAARREGAARDDDAADRLRHAFHWIDGERAATPSEPLERVIERAVARFALTAEQAAWVRWSLDPGAVALQSKEPRSSPR